MIMHNFATVSGLLSSPYLKFAIVLVVSVIAYLKVSKSHNKSYVPGLIIVTILTSYSIFSIGSGIQAIHQSRPDYPDALWGFGPLFLIVGIIVFIPSVVGLFLIIRKL